jgi:hypothetical protein
MDLASVLPLAFVMVAGPQIISAFFFATSENWRANSAAYVAGAAIGILAVVSAGYLLANVLGEDEGGRAKWIDWVIVALLLFAMLDNFRKRHDTEPPKWMGKLQGATPRMTLMLGFLLLGFFPSDLVTSLSVGGHIGNDGQSWWDVLPFVGLALLLLASPALGVLMLGRRAEAVLPRIRDWMTTNSWIVSELVLALFIILVLSG